MTVPVLEVEQLPNLDAWLRSLLWNSELPGLRLDPIDDAKDSKPPEIHRLKAKLPLVNRDIKIVQGVRKVFEILDAPKSDSTGLEFPREGKIVLIGRYLEGLKFEESFRHTIKSL